MQNVMFTMSRFIAFTHHKKNMTVVYILDGLQGLGIGKPYGSIGGFFVGVSYKELKSAKRKRSQFLRNCFTPIIKL